MELRRRRRDILSFARTASVPKGPIGEVLWAVAHLRRWPRWALLVVDPSRLLVDTGWDRDSSQRAIGNERSFVWRDDPFRSRRRRLVGYARRRHHADCLSRSISGRTYFKQRSTG